MSLLLAPFPQANLGWLQSAMEEVNQQRAMAERGRQAALEANLQHARQDAEIQRKADFDLMKLQQGQSNVDRAFTESARRYDAENAPFTVPPDAGSAASPAPSISVSSPSSEAAGLGVITDYGQKDDPYLDSLTAAGKSAIGNLREDSLALSPDLEAKMKAAGAKIGTPVKLTLSDGTELVRHWDDRTSDKLTGRVDLFSPSGPSPLRGKQVVSITPATGDMRPSQQIASVAKDLETSGLFTGKQAKSILTSFAGATYGSLARAQAKAAAQAPSDNNLYDNVDSALEAAKQYKNEGFFAVPKLQAKSGKYALNFYDRNQDLQARKSAEAEAKIIGATITDYKGGLRAAQKQVADLEKTNDIFTRTTGLFDSGDGKLRFGEKEKPSEKSRIATKQEADQFREYLAAKARITELEGELELKRSARDELSDIISNGVRSQHFAKPAVEESVEQPIADEKVAVISPTGQRGKIPKSQLEAALKNGFKLPQ